MEDLYRIGDKVISHQNLVEVVREILRLRTSGLSQKEVAKYCNIERSFISKLESLGEIRKGGRIGVVAFPVANSQELRNWLFSQGIDFVLVMGEKERWDFVQNNSGIDLVNQVMEWLAKARTCDALILCASRQRVRFLKNLLDKPVFSIVLGDSPIVEDKILNFEQLNNLVENVKGQFQEVISNETGS